MSCQPFTSIPTPPTLLPSCAVPVGGSNSSILDACCNGHINAISIYSSPDADPNSEDNDGCFQFCVTDSPDMVRGCLTEKMKAYEEGENMFQCFNTRSTKMTRGGYASGASAKGGLGWTVGVLMGLGFVGAMIGTI
ncbi:hypothetical protein T440DRAFT_147308 [Plenodomus tracheiphilus IPT5]|uniref:Uncharacterized protein n=1 Tax=Plenodomus tracheiphilus IPT5 TaxID=1408161 RepID=A0A6A7AZX8_9PLEO|nr:hypothetical protein T440DRAFT_147308 [Plenodomus tracheiphilus IPT5]